MTLRFAHQENLKPNHQARTFLFGFTIILRYLTTQDATQKTENNPGDSGGAYRGGHHQSYGEYEGGSRLKIFSLRESVWDAGGHWN